MAGNCDLQAVVIDRKEGIKGVPTWRKLQYFSVVISYRIRVRHEVHHFRACKIFQDSLSNPQRSEKYRDWQGTIFSKRNMWYENKNPDKPPL